MTQTLTRINSGINGLDNLLKGGIPFPSVVFLTGDAGSGKTTFSMQFLTEGAKKGERCLYISTLSESIDWMLKFTSQYDFIETKYFGNEIKYLDLAQAIPEMWRNSEELLSIINEKIAEVKPNRVVIDPVTVINQILLNDYRKFLYNLSFMLKNSQCAVLLTGELGNENTSMDAEYTSDGIIILYNKLEDMKRRNYLEILKMRGTAHEKGLYPYEISKMGIQIFPSN